jgi:hypothetical protein
VRHTLIEKVRLEDRALKRADIAPKLRLREKKERTFSRD